MHMLDKTCTAYFFDFRADANIFVICSNGVEQSRFWCRAVFSSRWISSSWPFSDLSLILIKHSLKYCFYLIDMVYLIQIEWEVHKTMKIKFWSSLEQKLQSFVCYCLLNGRYHRTFKMIIFFLRSSFTNLQNNRFFQIFDLVVKERFLFQSKNKLVIRNELCIVKLPMLTYAFKERKLVGDNLT